jgi:hypothetical protein
MAILIGPDGTIVHCEDDARRTIKVIRTIVYEGEAWWVKATLANSFEVGVVNAMAPGIIKVIDEKEVTDMNIVSLAFDNGNFIQFIEALLSLEDGNEYHTKGLDFDLRIKFNGDREVVQEQVHKWLSSKIVFEVNAENSVVSNKLSDLKEKLKSIKGDDQK